MSRGNRVNPPVIDRKTSFDAPRPRRFKAAERRGSAGSPRGRASALIVIVLIVGSFMAVLMSYTGQVSSAYTPRGPITISGDEDFTADNGVRGGAGILGSPYIISDWEITEADESSGAGIYIESTTKYFVITNVHINSTVEGAVVDTAIWFWEVSNGTVESCLINSTNYGVYVEESENITIQGNVIDDCDNPVLLDTCDCCRLLDNEMTNGDVAIWLATVSYSSVDGNRIDLYAYEGIYSWYVFDCLFSANVISNCSGGAMFMTWDCTDCIIRNNTLMDNDDTDYVPAALWLDGCTGIAVYNNSFYRNTPVHAYTTTGTGNLWNLSASSGGGNYWDDYAGVDDDDDGFGDTPYPVGNGAYDQLPLMEPPGSDGGGEIPEFGSVVVPVLAIMVVFLAIYRGRSDRQR